MARRVVGSCVSLTKAAGGLRLHVSALRSGAPTVKQLIERAEAGDLSDDELAEHVRAGKEVAERVRVATRQAVITRSLIRERRRPRRHVVARRGSSRERRPQGRRVAAAGRSRDGPLPRSDDDPDHEVVRAGGLGGEAA